MTYFNTTQEQEPGLSIKRRKVESQEELILQFFERNKHRSFTPFEVMHFMGNRWPITSVRRAITNLTEQGLLTKTEEKRKGNYGDKNYCWQFAIVDQNEPTLF